MKKLPIQQTNFTPYQLQDMENLLIFIGDAVSDGDVYAIDREHPMHSPTDEATVRNLLAKGWIEAARSESGRYGYILTADGRLEYHRLINHNG